MIYKINGKYYVSVGTVFKEIELVFTENDVDLKVIGTTLERTPGMVVEEINFMQEKDKLLKKHNESKKAFKSDLK